MSFIFNAIIFLLQWPALPQMEGRFLEIMWFMWVIMIIFFGFFVQPIFISCFYVTYDSFHFYFHLIFLMYKYIFYQSTFIDFLFPGLCIYAFTCTFIREKPRSKPKKEKKNDSKLCFFRGFILIILVSRLLFHLCTFIIPLISSRKI